uniref:Uncharacterized protein n=1 Tax=Lotharella globosa TaxID=91324 RepID=A0A6V3JW99_9EUKA
MWRRSKSPRGRDGQLNKQAALEQFHRFFGFDSSEKVLHVCACGLKSSKNSGGFFSGSKSTIEGILYGSTNHLSFIDPRNKKLQTKLPLENVTAIRPGMDSTSLQVETSERKHYFVDFKDRNESMGRFMEIWTQHQSRAASSAFDDPLSIGANVQVMGQNVKVTGRDAMAAAAFAKRHSDKVKVGLNADGSVNVKINPRGRAASSKKKQAAGNRHTVLHYTFPSLYPTFSFDTCIHYPPRNKPEEPLYNSHGQHLQLHAMTIGKWSPVRFESPLYSVFFKISCGLVSRECVSMVWFWV